MTRFALLLVACGLAVASCKSRSAPAPAPSAASAAPAASVPAPSASAPIATTSAPVPVLSTPCPEGMALIDGAFCIDRWEASLLDEDGGEHSPYKFIRAKKVKAVTRPGVVPQAYIAASEADAACKRSGKRLCTTDQWVRACSGSTRPKRVYPYGMQKKKGACNINRPEHPVTKVFAKHLTDSESLNDPRLNQQSETVAKTGEFVDCVTPEGVFDMQGNLLEWTRSTYVRPLAMGGYYLDGEKHGAGCAYVTSAHGDQYHDFTTGFRCCASPDRDALAALKQSDAPHTTTAVAADPDAGQRDPPGMRGFASATGRLPEVKPPPYEPEDAACPVDMVEVAGERCSSPEQRCKEWLPRLSVGQKIACKEFAPSVCEGPKRKMRYCIDRYEFQPDGYAYPLTHVNWGEAQNLCRAMDKRLCMEDEWEFACEGPDALPYPYGLVRDGKRCNHDFPEEQLVTAPDQFIDRRLAAKSLPDCKSPFGVFNLVGNVDEWTTRYNREPPKRSILRGGWWLIGRNRCRAATDNHSELYAGMQTGFRCCKAARRSPR